VQCGFRALGEDVDGGAGKSAEIWDKVNNRTTLSKQEFHNFNCAMYYEDDPIKKHDNNKTSSVCGQEQKNASGS